MNQFYQKFKISHFKIRLKYLKRLKIFKKMTCNEFRRSTYAGLKRKGGVTNSSFWLPTQRSQNPLYVIKSLNWPTNLSFFLRVFRRSLWLYTKARSVMKFLSESWPIFWANYTDILKTVLIILWMVSYFNIFKQTLNNSNIINYLINYHIDSLLTFINFFLFLGYDAIIDKVEFYKSSWFL